MAEVFQRIQSGESVVMSSQSNREALNAFFAKKEKRALGMAEFAVANREDALDIVQDAMMRFATRYANKPEAEWAPLFHRVLQSRIQDFFRKSSVKNKYFAWLPVFNQDRAYGNDEASVDPIQLAGDYEAISVDRILDSDQNAELISKAVKNLPPRQQQAFLLRCWEGLDTKSTAASMQCSEGSVKTHYARALNHLKLALQSAYNEQTDKKHLSKDDEQHNERRTA